MGNKLRIICFASVALLHLALLFLLVFDIDVRSFIPEPPPEILKLSDIEEDVPPPPPPKIQQVTTNTVESVAENMIETDVVPTEIAVSNAPVYRPAPETDYLPQHKISVTPSFNARDLKKRIVYPPIAQRSGIEGQVMLELFIDSDGFVRRVIVQKETPEGRGFAAAAIAAFDGAKADSPALANGKPVACRYRYPVRFRLN
jgi:protein TonB